MSQLKFCDCVLLFHPVHTVPMHIDLVDTSVLFIGRGNLSG
jgi:hypothetical protein